MLIGNLKSIVQVVNRLVLAELVEIDQIRAVTMDEGAKGKTVLPADELVD